MEWTRKEVLDMSTKLRTQGDGMEEHSQDESSAANKPVVVNVQGIKITTPTRNQNIASSSKTSCSSPLAVDFPKNLINLTPKEIHYVTKKAKVMSKEPKFVPYEPYKAAIKPILPISKNVGNEKKKKSKNNLDLNVLVEQMAMMDTNPITFKSQKKKTSTSSSVTVKENEAESPVDSEKKQWEMEKQLLQNEVQSLKKENRILHEQISQQAQVNKELKTMLVASMGEDLNATVQTLTEDKQQLASALLNSAQHLSTHQEQTEWLAGQCEVWRSKFLASSLMVEELAGLKTLFTRRTEELENTLRQILEERNRVRDILIHIYRNLKSLHENWLTNLASKEMYYTSLSELGGFGVIEQTPIGNINLDLSKPKSSNIIELSSLNLKFSENLCNGIEKLDDFTAVLNELEVNTVAENTAEKLLAKPLDISVKNDRPSLALVHHAYTLTGLTPGIACCSHCNGEIQLL